VTDVEQARLVWIQQRPRYDRFCSLIEQRLRLLLKPLGIWFDVEARAKEVDSLVKKLLLKPVHTFETLPDKAGARVVIRYRSDVRRVVETVQARYETDPPDDKLHRLGIDRVGYQSVHLDRLRLREGDPDVAEYPPNIFWAELQVRTLAQHLWCEMSHDSVYKNDEMVADLPDDIKRRVNLMAGQIEVADREFDRLNSELKSEDAIRLLHTLEKHYYTLSSRRPDIQLSMDVLKTLMPLVKVDMPDFAGEMNDFLSSKHSVLEHIYIEASAGHLQDATALLFQPEVLLIYKLLSSDPNATRKLWSEHYPEAELERIANTFGISLD